MQPLARPTAMIAAQSAGRALLVRRSSVAAASSFNNNTMQAMQANLDVENMLKSLHWAFLEDNVKEIRSLMNEPKTNHAIIAPDIGLEAHVAHELKEIQEMIAVAAAGSSTKKDEVATRIGNLKRFVKAQLYSFQ